VREFRTAVEQTEIKAPDGRRLERVTMACEIKDLDEKTGRGVGYLSVYGNEDSYGDVVDEGSMVKTCSERSPSNPLPFLWQHYSDEPIGVYTRLDPRDSYGLKTEFQYALGVQRAREAFELAQMRACHGQSIGFTTLKDSKDSTGLRHLQEIRLWEGSQVTFPANDLAGITAVKSGMAQYEGVLETLREIRSMLEQKWDGSAGRYTDSEWAAACILDRGEGAGTAKERYGLPIAVPGKSAGSDPDPGGVHAAAARINQVHASPEAKHAAYKRLASAYHKIGEEVPTSVAEGAKSVEPQTAELASLVAELKAALGGAAAPIPAQPANATDAELEAVRLLRKRMEDRLSEVSK
jgi:uncharacterized protein